MSVGIAINHAVRRCRCAAGLPLAYVAAFKLGLGVKGFVMAIGATSLTQSLIVGSIISRWGAGGGAGCCREGARGRGVRCRGTTVSTGKQACQLGRAIATSSASWWHWYPPFESQHRYCTIVLCMSKPRRSWVAMGVGVLADTNGANCLVPSKVLCA